jgi:hypothetical protein
MWDTLGMRRALILFFILPLFSLGLVFASPRAMADSSSREFVMSCTYGVLAGTLVGAASLAFTDKPSDHMNKVARGASLGLYAGILLGLYVVYIVPGMEPADEDPVAMMDKVPLQLYPTFNDRGGADGLEASLKVFRF